MLESIKTGPDLGEATVQNLSFTFDSLGNLRSRTGTTTAETETLDYDVLNRLTSSKQGTISYYDNGNIQKKTDVSGTAATTNFLYNGDQPHAVTSAFGYAMTYDANGNLATRTHPTGNEEWSLSWTGFDQPRWMAKTTNAGTAGSAFLYDANRSRVVHLEFDTKTGTGETATPGHYTRKKIYAAGPAMEVDYVNTAASGAPVWQQKKIRLYIPAPDGTVGAVEFPAADTGGVVRELVYHHDHLGSIESITRFGTTTGSTYATDASGLTGKFSEDAWGARRNPTTWTGAPTTTDDGGADSLTPRGFTGHEMLDGLGLVHANGRIYDPLLGRFLSADAIIQAPGDLQSFNRYSYVFNNPLSHTDPSGNAAVVVAPVLVTAGKVAIAAVGAYVVYRGTEIALQETIARIHAAQDRREVRLKAEQRLRVSAVSAPQAGDGGKLDTTVVTENPPVLTTGAPTPSLPLENEKYVPDAAAASVQVETVPAAYPSDTPITTGNPAPVVDLPMQTEMSKETGSYTNHHESGKTYDGKGDRARSQTSARRVEKETGDTHIATEWTPAGNTREAFKEESKRLDSHGGAKSTSNHNKIESPGRKLRKEDGELID